MLKLLVSAILALLILLASAGVVFAQPRRPGGDGQPRADQGKQLEIGEMAPTFKLKSLDGKEETDLEKFRGKKPVVPFFGSYT